MNKYKVIGIKIISYKYFLIGLYTNGIQCPFTFYPCFNMGWGDLLDYL